MVEVAVRMLGGIEARVDGRHMSSVPSAFFRLGAYMILSGNAMTVPRQRIAAMLWPEAGSEQASANLRQGLARVKAFQEQHGFRLFDWNHSVITLASDANLTCDLIQFLEAQERMDAEASILLCKLYTGELLADVLDSGTEYDKWLQYQRSRIKEMFVDKISMDLAAGLVPSDHAVACAKRLLEVDRCNEQAYRTLIADAAERGDGARAAGLYRRCEEALMAEMGVRPSRRTQELFGSIIGSDAAPSTTPVRP